MGPSAAAAYAAVLVAGVAVAMVSAAPAIERLRPPRAPRMLRRMADHEDSDAEAQSEETLMPWIWGGFGLFVIAVFVVWAFIGAPHASPGTQHPAGPPVMKPINPGY